MGTRDTWNVEINILVDENKVFSLLAEFHFNNLKIKLHFQYYWKDLAKLFTYDV